ncbi:hypothetical protein FHS59_000335 [Algoriphagus iocasae]|jgi:hypothetical protein|uniref:Uncharacterized protein n=1 Tax=Algoriphagus iocasae TaxID=1836499 RepID=A0A841MBN3_9BACT|nr:hypothetical protein [Algoriphagus iocasae]MBB6324720.1 hypothetical protein [Algoriphagus iocasae]
METMKLERKKRLRKLAIWSWSWVATLMIATFGPMFIWEGNAFLTYFFIVINLANGVLMILANRNLFNHFDELEKKIHLESMAISLGLGIVVGITFSLLGTLHLIPFEPDISFLVMFIAISYMIALSISKKRFK